MVRICTPWRHPESGIFWFRKRVPERLRERVGRREIKFSLRTRDPAVARLRGLEALVEFERAWVLIQDELSEWRAKAKLVLVEQPNAEAAQAIPTWSDDGGRAAPSIKLRSLFDAYAQEAELAPSTVKRWTVVIDRLQEHLGHDDAAKVGRADVVSFKDTLLKSVSNVTVRDVYIAALKAMFQYALDQGIRADNPVLGVKVRVKEAMQEREKGFTHDEAKAILKATLVLPSGKISVEMAAARRWVPWICAYTGARVNEITCLSASDLVERDGIPVLRIRAETVKTRRWREVPVHPHLVEQGFLRLIASRGAKPLFYDPARSRGGKDASPHYKKVGERLAEWVRTLGIDPRVAPNHGWRHRFSSVARSVGIPEDIRNVIQGHASEKTADRYGDTWPETALREIAKLPPYRIGGTTEDLDRDG